MGGRSAAGGAPAADGTPVGHGLCFRDPSEGEAALTEPPEERRLAAVMFADVVGYTRLMAEDEAAGIEVRARHREVARPLVEAYGGRWIEERGDESLSVFPSALDAVNCALALQQATAAERDLTLRIGIDLGDVVFRGEAVLGDGVNVAARVRETAAPRTVHVTRRVFDSVKNQGHVVARAIGGRRLKNVARPLHIFELSGSPGPPPASPGAGGERSRREAIRSLAVLPLANLSDDPGQQHFVDGMTEQLISHLAKIRSLRVVSRTSMLQYADSRKPLPEIARELGVDGVIEGSAAREGDRVRVTAQLIDGIEDRHLWAESYERDVRGLLALQSEIARSVAREIRLQLSPHEEAQLAGPLGRWFARIRSFGVPED